MGLFDAFSYKGKRALVVGGATGMGAAAAELVQDAGAEVVVMDRAEITLGGVKAIPLDLSDKASIDAAVAECRRPGARPVLVRRRRRRHAGHRAHQLHRAPLPDRQAARRRHAPPRLGHRHDLVRRRHGLGEQPRRAARVPRHHRLRRGRASGRRTTYKADYMWSKKTINAYVAREAFGLLKKGIRINAIMPGPTDTPLAQANKEMWLAFGADYRDEVGIEASTPLEQAYPLVFLCSDAAAGVTGITIDHRRRLLRPPASWARSPTPPRSSASSGRPDGVALARGEPAHRRRAGRGRGRPDVRDDQPVHRPGARLGGRRVGRRRRASDPGGPHRLRHDGLGDRPRASAAVPAPAARGARAPHRGPPTER